MVFLQDLPVEQLVQICAYLVVNPNVSMTGKWLTSRSRSTDSTRCKPLVPTHFP
jgi:hypothetical protein